MITLEQHSFTFDGLFTLEMANNHQGSVAHGKLIIDEFSKVVEKAGVRAAIKFQFRDLDTFIHPDHLSDEKNKHIKRFLSTRLSRDEFAELVSHARARGLIPMATPFDEPSVDLLVALGVDIIKVASCSAKDWPLLEKVASIRKPIIISTGGLTVSDIDKLVSFFDHRYAQFALMHCVAIYPTPNEKLQLNFIDVMKRRYPSLTIGFSTHEAPDNFDPIMVAYAKGARIFERHVGVATDKITLNAYSSTPSQIEQWFSAHAKAVAMCGGEGRMSDATEDQDLALLQRAAFAKRDIKEGETIGHDDVFFAIPYTEGALTSGAFKPGVAANRAYKKKEALDSVLAGASKHIKHFVYPIIHEIKGMLNEARIAVGPEFGVELSHHYGLERFREVGVTIIDCINREYCKKILIQLPGQQHPYHHHKKKEEAFQVLSGELIVELEGRRRVLYPGDTLVVQRGVKHAFWTETGVIFEEISSTHYNDDSIYEDPAINDMPREARKTKLDNWGRYQFD